MTQLTNDAKGKDGQLLAQLVHALLQWGFRCLQLGVLWKDNGVLGPHFLLF